MSKVKKQETKPEKIWVTIVGHNGKVNHQQIDNTSWYYDCAINAGNYALSKKGAETAWKKTLAIYEEIRKFEGTVVKVLKAVKVLAKTSKLPKKSVKKPKKK